MENKKGLKNRASFSNYVDTRLLEKFRELSSDTRIPISKLLDEAIEDLLKKYNK